MEDWAAYDAKPPLGFAEKVVSCLNRQPRVRGYSSLKMMQSYVGLQNLEQAGEGAVGDAGKVEK